MRVLHVISTNQLRGAEVFAADLVRAANELAIDQRVAVLRGCPAAGVRFDAPTAILRPGACHRASPGVDLRLVRRIRRLVTSWRPHVVQVHGGEPLKHVIVGLVGSSVPVVYRRIGSAHPRVARGWRRALYGRLIRSATKVIAVSETVRRETIEVLGVPPEVIVTIPNAVDLSRLRQVRDRSAMRSALAIPETATVILSVGALTWEKDPLALVDVVARALHVRDDARALIVGDGSLRDHVGKAVAGLGLADRIQVLGERGDVPDLLRASDVVLLASATEGMPAIAIEAAELGLPIAAFDVGGMRDIVGDGTTGLLAPAGDRAALAERLLWLLDDPIARATMGEAAAARAPERPNLRAVAAMYVEIYREVQGGARRSVAVGDRTAPCADGRGMSRSVRQGPQPRSSSGIKEDQVPRPSDGVRRQGS
jgi:glycosyltransferase involved in cell wall biosynthesis